MASLDDIAAKYSSGQGWSSNDPLDVIAQKVNSYYQPDDNSGGVKIGKDAFPETLRSTVANADWFSKNLAAAGTAVPNLVEGVKQLVGQANPDTIRNNGIIREEAPAGALVGDAALTAVPFGLAGNSIPKAMGIGGAYGLSQPVQGNDVVSGKLMNGALGLASAGGGQFMANKLLGATTNKLSAIEQKVQEKAAQVAASDTASARSAAGNAAQNAYRQLEHLRELGLNRALTPEESLMVTSLERELSEKALKNLMPAAALKESTSQAYKDAMQTEAERAAKYAAEKLSSQEAKQQFMARLKRYGPAVAGGALGHMMLPGVGTMGGIAGGLYLRPALRSMINLAQNPAVQHGLLSGVSQSGLLTKPVLPISGLLAAEGLFGQ